ncbi:taste receptor type 2 member 123-like [Hyla sarda]|uniref:taste receptor type 2 member 123-like n=1 Tax=Hyla sarda TaxID=327740 RepID=UPI0024C269E5|nr:taste receptor type 2 member 123-like [Hyla sarda]
MALPPDSTAVLTISALEAAAGMVSSSFIGFHILKNISKGQTISTIDKILLALSISNMVSPITLLSSIVNHVVWNEMNISSMLRYMMVLYCMSSCSWLTVCLSFFYYSKVMQFRSRYLSRLKNNIDSLTPWTILVVEVISLGGSFMNVMKDFIPGLSPWNSDVTTNITKDSSTTSSLYEVMYLSNFVLYPCMIVLTVWIMASVIMHIHRMRRNISTARTINLEVHQRVVRTLQHLVAFYVVFYLLLIIEYNISLPGV